MSHSRMTSPGDAKAFETFVRAGVRYLAYQIDTGTMVIDERGNVYGAWASLDRFKAETNPQRFGTCRLTKIDQ
jgi:hypothetical protein